MNYAKGNFFPRKVQKNSKNWTKSIFTIFFWKTYLSTLHKVKTFLLIFLFFTPYNSALFFFLSRTKRINDARNDLWSRALSVYNFSISEWKKSLLLTQNVFFSADVMLVVDGIWKLDRRHYRLSFHLKWGEKERKKSIKSENETIWKITKRDIDTKYKSTQVLRATAHFYWLSSNFTQI